MVEAEDLPMVSGFGMECWGLKVWGSLESWVRVRVTGSDGSLSGFRVLSGFGGGKVRSENYVRVRVTGGGVPKEEPDPNGSIDRRFLGPLGQLPHFPWLSPFRVSR